MDVCRAAMNGEVPISEVPLPSSPATGSGSSALDEAMAKTLAAIDPITSDIPMPEPSEFSLMKN